MGIVAYFYVVICSLKVHKSPKNNAKFIGIVMEPMFWSHSFIYCSQKSYPNTWGMRAKIPPYYRKNRGPLRSLRSLAGPINSATLSVKETEKTNIVAEP